MADGWDGYISRLIEAGAFRGGNSMGDGLLLRSNPTGAASLSPIVGYLIITAPNLGEAENFVSDNPIYLAGGTVERRYMVKDEFHSHRTNRRDVAPLKQTEPTI